MFANLKNFNPVFWLMWLIPGTAVVAGVGMVVVALKDADRALPAMYHWEGERLDADFERARRAAQLGVHASLQWGAAGCSLLLKATASKPRALQLHLTHSENAGLDRTITLLRDESGDYHAACEKLPQGRWRAALVDDAGSWSVRTQFEGAVQRLELRARDPAGKVT